MTYPKSTMIENYNIIKKGESTYRIEITLKNIARITREAILDYVLKDIHDPIYFFRLYILNDYWTLKCPNCNKTFYITYRAYQAWQNSCKNNISCNGPFCSEKCYHEYRKGKPLMEFDYGIDNIPEDIMKKINKNKIIWKKYNCPVCDREFILYGARYSQRKKYEWMYEEKHHDGTKLPGPYCCTRCKSLASILLMNQAKRKKRL